MPQVNPTTSVPKVVINPLRMRWRNIILGLFIGTTLIGGAIIAFYYFELQSLAPIQNPQIIISKPKTATGSASPTPEQPKVINDEIANWRTLTTVTRESDPSFTNQKTINFSFRYPVGFRVVNDEGTEIATNDTNYQLKLMTEGAISMWGGIGGSKTSQVTSTNVTLGGMDAKRISSNTSVTYFIQSIETKEGDEVSFTFNCVFIPIESVDAVKICDQVESTFKFLE